MAEHGYSRDGKPRDRQVLVGVVMVDGWPITHHVFRGKLRDSQTVATVLDDLKQRFGLRRVVFVGDRGMVTTDNLKLLRASEQGYIVGLTRRRREEVYRYIERATGPWLECPSASSRARRNRRPRPRCRKSPRTSPACVSSSCPATSALPTSVRSDSNPWSACVSSSTPCRNASSGHLKAPEKIGAAAARILARSHGQRYFDQALRHPRYRTRRCHLEGSRHRRSAPANTLQGDVRARVVTESKNALSTFRGVDDFGSNMG